MAAPSPTAACSTGPSAVGEISTSPRTRCLSLNCAQVLTHGVKKAFWEGREPGWEATLAKGEPALCQGAGGFGWDENKSQGPMGYGEKPNNQDSGEERQLPG